MQSLPKTEFLIHQGIDSGFHIGVQVCASINCEVIADLAVGEARPGVAMRSETLMPWLSCTKPFGAVVIGQLIERGDLSVEDPVSNHVPEFAHKGKESVTLRHLLTHTGGFRQVDFDWQKDDWDDIIRRICTTGLEPGWIPGQKAGYHKDTSWYILAEIVQRKTGRPFADLVREKIFEPLGMVDSWVVLNANRYREYGDQMGILQDTSDAQAGLRPHPGWDTEEGASICRPGGGARGPAKQLVRLYETLLDGGQRCGTRILAAETVRLLTSRHREDMFDETFRHRVDWGLGFIVDSNRYGAATLPYGFGLHASPDAFGHGGQQSSAAFADPRHGLAVAVIANGTPGEPRHNKRARELHTAIYEDLGLTS